MDSELQRRVSATVERLRAVVGERNVFLTADDRISEVDAASLVGYAPGSLRNMRASGGGPAFFNRPLGGSAKSYRLEDIANWLEQSREVTL